MIGLRIRPLRAAIAAPLYALLVVASVALPVVERADVSDRIVLESTHDPASCPRPHDHTVCTQLGSSPSAPAARTDRALLRAPSVRDVVSTPGLALVSRTLSQSPARAPPAA